MRLAPGFRFYPTDVELVLYYLKRKIMGKKLKSEAIAEVNIYKYSPWDLPDKSSLKSKDLEWFFFCPREKKYSSGVRVKRATENGYWKTTGKDRTVSYNEKTVGAVKTLIFHLGHAPHGERTDWVIHEYRILDNQLDKAGVQDSYALCKLFKKNGLGPKNGAQYGAPFNEADWTDDDDVANNESISMEAEGPSRALRTQNEEHSAPLGSMFDSENGWMPIIEGGPTASAVAPLSMEASNMTNDEIAGFLASLAYEDMLLPIPNENGLNKDKHDGDEHTILLPFDEGLDIYNCLPDLDSWKTPDEGNVNFSGLQNVECPLNMLPEDNSNYIELDDLLPPLDCPNGVTGNHISSLCQASAPASYSHEQQSHSGTKFAGMDLCTSFENEIGAPAANLSEGDFLYMTQMVDNQLYLADNASYNFEFLPGQLDNAEFSSHHMERGSHLIICIPAHLPSAAKFLALSPCGGSSIHIKAEVTHGAGECTNEALEVMVGGSSSCWCNLLFRYIQLWVVEGLLNLVEFVSYLILVCCLNDTVLWSSHYYHLNKKAIIFSSTTKNKNCNILFQIFVLFSSYLL